MWRLQQAIDAGKLDAKQPVDAVALKAAGIIRRELDGVRLLGHGEITSKLELNVYSASSGAIKAIEAAGGSVTQARSAIEAANAAKPKKMVKKAKSAD